MSREYRRRLIWRVVVRYVVGVLLLLVPGSVVLGETVIMKCENCRVTEEVDP